MKRRAKQFLALLFSVTLTVTGIPNMGMSTVKATEEIAPLTQEFEVLTSEEFSLPEVAEGHITDVVNAIADYDAFGMAIAELCSQTEMPDTVAYGMEDDYATCRLIVKTDGGDIDWNALGADTVIQGPENHYILQFANEDTTKKVEKWLNANIKVIYVEPDTMVKLLDGEEPIIEEPVVEEPVIEEPVVEEPVIEEPEIEEPELDNPEIEVPELEDPIDEIPTGEFVQDEANSLSWGVSHIGAKAYADSIKNLKNPGIIVAVVDTGAEFTHPFLQGRLTSGYDFVDNDSDATDLNKHGTHVSGTIVDCTEGLAGKITIMPVRVLDADGRGYSSAVGAGIRYAADHGASVINMSLGGSCSPYKDEAVAYARSKGLVVVVSAGNDNRDVDANNVCPAHIAECITVTALDSNETKAYYSNYGASCDVAAPGSSINSSVLNGGYASLSGTSMASPHVTALAAMLRYKYPAADNVTIDNIITTYTRDLGDPGKDIYYGYGIVDLTPLVGRDPSNKYSTITFDANGGTGGPTSLRKYEGIPATIPSTVPTRAGYDFRGWATSSKGQAVYQPGDTYNVDGNITLYAVWGALEILNSFPRDYVVSISSGGQIRSYSFVPKVSGQYTFESKASVDTYCELYDANNTRIAYNDDGGEGSNFKLTYNFTAGTQYYVKARMYSSSRTGEYTMTASTTAPLTIVTQPKSVSAKVGDVAKFTTAVNYSQVNYQWQYSQDAGKTWTNSSSASSTTATYELSATEKRNGYKVRCIITDKNNSSNKVTTSAATLTVAVTLAITTQPKSTTVDVGESASFSVKVNKTDVTYQWQYSKDGGKTWENSGASTAKKATVTVNGKTTNNGYKYRCVIKDSTGKKVTSNAATLNVNLPLAITTQPKSVTIAVGESASFSVKVNRTDVTYQWQYSKDGGKTWENSGASTAKKATVTVNGKTTNDGYKYRCVIKDSTGKKVTSNAATLNVKQPLAITTQPTSVTVTVGASASFSVKVNRTDVTYQWQYSKDNGTTWENSGASTAKTATVTVNGKTTNNGYKYRCVIKDSTGTKVTSKAAKLTTVSALKITTQPVAVSVSEGQDASFSVKANLTNVTYQWQYSKDGGKTWADSKSSSGKTNTYTLIDVAATKNGYKIRCVVTDPNSGKKVTSSAVALTVKARFSITKQPVSTNATIGSSVSFSITAVGSGLTYQWQYSKDGGKTWSNSSSTSGTTNTYKLTMKDSYNSYKFRCVVKNYAGSKLTSSVVTVKSSTPKNGWYYNDGKYYWYENGVRQGTSSDPKGVWGDGAIRGREIYDPSTNAWYWLDASRDGAKATNKEVWLPYVYAGESGWTDEQKVAAALNSGDMGPVVLDAMRRGTGKWARYDANGRLIVGWYTTSDNKKYYYDPVTGLMAKGYVTLSGKTYHFDEITGVLLAK